MEENGIEERDLSSLASLLKSLDCEQSYIQQMKQLSKFHKQQEKNAIGKLRI